MTGAGLPTSRVNRSLRLAGLAGRTVADRAQTRIGRRLGGESAEAAEHARQARLAERYRRVMGDMKGATMKAGQIFSYVNADALIPASERGTFQNTLTALQDDVPPLAFEEISEVIHAELGAWPEKLFASFSGRPVAAASIGQVHYARTSDATELAVKVQYPGVAQAVRADLANTELFASIISTALGLLGPQAPRIDPKMVAEEIRDRVTDELDYRLEAANQQAFHTLYEGHPFIRVPAVHPQFSTSRVLVTDFVRGQRWSNATNAQASTRALWGEAIFRFVYTSLYRHGLFNADPHPGNYLFHPDGGVTFLDFGCVQKFTTDRISVMSALLDATLAGSATGLASALTRLGMLTGKDDTALDHQRLLDFYRAVLADRVSPQPFTYTPEWAGEVVAHTYQPLGPWYDITRRLHMPKELMFLNRILIGASSVLGHLYASADWKAIDHEIRHQGSPATSLGRAEAEWRLARPRH
jgi:predicted unusual protein kinase regulating ubiquinone biosynthesis (AarF/ABC1/UbiB family)